MNEETTKRGRRWPKGQTLPSRLPPIHKMGKKGYQQPVHDQIYEQLRHMILHGKLKPGAWLRQGELTRSLGVSRTPVREALRSLNQEGLVDLMPNHGARVATLSMEEFEELYALRSGIEGLAARLGARCLNMNQLTELRERLEQLEMLATQAELGVYLYQEWMFRLYIYEATGRESLLVQVKSLRERAERYLRLAYTVEGRIEESLLFHKRLLEACEQGNAEAAEHIVQEALNWTLKRAGPIIAAGIQHTADSNN